MIRSLFLALGLYCFLLGLECLFVEKAVLVASGGPLGRAVANQVAPGAREFIPADWAPWSLMSTGAVVMLYTITLPKKIQS